MTEQERHRLTFVPLQQMAADTARMEASSRNGIACPSCGCRATRVETTRRSDNMVVRYRVCLHCGTRKTTIET
jgi:hypothetical protein